jgi:hypothetical protein
LSVDGAHARGNRRELALLAEALCSRGDSQAGFRGGFLPMMGLAAGGVNMRVFRATAPIRFLMMPAEHCHSGRPLENARLIIWHIVRPGEGLYYLTTVNGELAVAVEGFAANRANYLLASTTDPDVMIDFDTEKSFWLERLKN